jgi:cell wall-associated NlpC family hydrolase
MISNLEEFVGKPFLKYGRGPDGYDCWGIVLAISKLLGMRLPDYKDISHAEYERVWNVVHTHLPEFDVVDNPNIGDIVLFKNISGQAHFGIMISKYMFINCNEEFGVHISSRNGFSEHLIKGFYRWKIKSE